MTAFANLIRALRTQSEICGQMGSPFNEGLLERVALDLEAGGPSCRLFARWEATGLRGLYDDGVMIRIAQSIAADKANGVYGISLLWVNGLLYGAADALKPLFDSALAIAKGNRDDADRRIESTSRPVGRALREP